MNTSETNHRSYQVGSPTYYFVMLASMLCIFVMTEFGAWWAFVAASLCGIWSGYATCNKVFGLKTIKRRNQVAILVVGILLSVLGTFLAIKLGSLNGFWGGFVGFFAYCAGAYGYTIIVYFCLVIVLRRFRSSKTE